MPHQPDSTTVFDRAIHEKAHIMASHMFCDWIELAWLDSGSQNAPEPHFQGIAEGH